MSVTIEVSSTQPGDAWRAHLASELAALHPGAHIRVAYGLVDDVFVWDDEFGFCDENAEPERTSIVDAIIRESRDSFAAVVVAAEDLAERVDIEVMRIFRVWSGANRRPLARIKKWLKRVTR